MGPTFFLNGSLSVQYDDKVYQGEFPNCKILKVEGAGHYVYIDKSQTAVRLIAECL